MKGEGVILSSTPDLTEKVDGSEGEILLHGCPYRDTRGFRAAGAKNFGVLRPQIIDFQ